MKNYLILIAFCVLLVGCEPVVTNYAECVDAGYTAIQSSPAQCKTPDEKIFYNVLNFEQCATIGQPVMESYPRQCAYLGKTWTEETFETPNLPVPNSDPMMIAEIAAESNCSDVGILTPEMMYNNVTKTWWITILPKEEFSHCNPSCVVFEEDNHTEVNYRCTGLDDSLADD